jgi:hypothetical protein
VEKYCKAGLATDGNMAHADYMPDNEGYTHARTHNICITYCFSTAAVIARTLLNVIEHCLFRYLFENYT